MALYPEGDKLDQFSSRYVLTNLAARRAKEIKDGAPILVQTTSTHPLTIALEEIAEGAVRPIFVEGEVLPAQAETLDSMELLARESSFGDIGDFGGFLGGETASTFTPSPGQFEDEEISLDSLLEAEEARSGEREAPVLDDLEDDEALLD